MNNYDTHTYYNCIDSYTLTSNDEEWLPCPKCKLIPKIWEFNNGRYTACGCWNTTYNRFKITAPTIFENFEDYDWDKLRKNWNNYCLTGKIV